MLLVGLLVCLYMLCVVRAFAVCLSCCYLLVPVMFHCVCYVLFWLTLVCVSVMTCLFMRFFLLYLHVVDVFVFVC